MHTVGIPITDVRTEGPFDAQVIEQNAPSPYGTGGDPQPLDAPFGANVNVEALALDQGAISVAGGAGQDVYAAYETPVGATFDVRVARSTNGGATWTVLTLPAVTYSRRHPSVLFFAPSTVLVFIEHTDATAASTFRYLSSSNGGTSWNTVTIGMPPTFPFTNFKTPGATACRVANCTNGWGPPASPTPNGAVYVGYEGTCTFADCAPSAAQTAFFSNVDPFGTSQWLIEQRSGGGPTAEGFRPVMGANDINEYLLIEFELQDNAAWDVYMFTSDPVTGLFSAIRICGTTCMSDMPIYGALSVLGGNVTFGGGYHNPAFFGTANVVMNVVNSPVYGGGVANWRFIQGGNGYFQAPSANQKYLSLYASGDVVHAAYRDGTSVLYFFSIDGGNMYQGAYRASSNALGTVADVPHAVSVGYGIHVGIGFIDSRNGNNDAWFATLSGASMYVIKKNPASLGGTIDIDLVGTPVPAAYIWNLGDSHRVNAPSPQAGPPDTQYVWQSWSDAGAQDHSFTVGAVDVVLVANYQVQYYLRMSAAVGTVSPGDSWQDAGVSVNIQWTAPPPSPGIQYVFGGWTGLGPGSYTGLANPTPIVMLGPVTEIADATRQFEIRVDTSPTGLQIIIDMGSPQFAPQTVWWDEGTTHTIQAVTPQSPGAPTQRYSFDRWDIGPSPGTPTQTVTATAPLNYIASFFLEYQVTINTNPAGRQVTIDGVTQTAPLTLWWRSGFSHLVDVPSPQTSGPDTRYVYVSWSDGGAQSHSIGPVSTAMSLTVTFDTQYRYVIDTNPSGAGLVISVDGGPNMTAPQTFWWNAGSSHTVRFPTPQTLTPDSRRVFLQWNDASPLNPRTFTSGTTTPGAWTIQTALEYRWQFATVPPSAGIVIQVNGAPITAPGQVWLRDGTTATIAAPSPSPDPVNPAGIQYVWQTWSNGGAQTQNLGVGGPMLLTATYQTQYYLTVTTPYGTAIGQTWYPAGTTAFAGVSAGVVAGPTGTQYVFTSWGSDASGTIFSQSNGILMNGPKNAVANWKTQYLLTVTTTHRTGSCSVPSCWYDAGDLTATATVDQTIDPAGVGIRWKFTNWGNGASGTGATSNPITMNAPKTAVANWVQQFLVTVTPGQAGVTASCSNADCWYDSGSTATVSLDTGGVNTAPGTRIGFTRWSGDAAGTDYQQSTAILVDGPKAVTVEWQTQYQLTLQNFDPAGTGSVVTQLGWSGDEGWYNAGESAQLSVPTVPVTGTASGTRWVFQSWGGAATGTGASTSVVMDGPKTVSLTWQKQYLVLAVAGVGTTPLLDVPLTVGGNRLEPLTGIWWNDGASITIVAPNEATSGGKTYVLTGWTDATGGGASGTFTVTGPAVLIANYREKGALESPVVLGGIIAAILAAVLIAVLLLWRRKRGAAEAAPPATAGAAPGEPAAPPPPGEGTMQCPSCDMTIPAKAGPCPICGTEVAPPAAPAQDEKVQRLTEAYQSGRISKEQYQANMRRLRGNT